MNNRPHDISIHEAVIVWLRVAALSFGGPAGQIAVMHRILGEEKKWIGEKRFLHALNYCMLLPGPEAQQLAVYSARFSVYFGAQLYLRDIRCLFQKSIPGQDSFKDMQRIDSITDQENPLASKHHMSYSSKRKFY